MRLGGRTAIVTGAGGGIGRSASLALAAEGAHVLAVDLDAARAATTRTLIHESGGSAVALTCDVSDATSVDEMYGMADEYGPADILVNSAGVGLGGDALTVSPVDWDRTLNVNVRGMWLCSRGFIARAVASERQAAIINISSTNAFFAEPGDVAYTASKGAVSALTRQMALDFARRGVRINCICPGIIETPLIQTLLSSVEDPVALRAHWDDLHALGRMGVPEDISPLIVFLATDDARFIIGAEIVIDGGYSIGVRNVPDRET